MKFVGVLVIALLSGIGALANGYFPGTVFPVPAHEKTVGEFSGVTGQSVKISLDNANSAAVNWGVEEFLKTLTAAGFTQDGETAFNVKVKLADSELQMPEQSYSIVWQMNDSNSNELPQVTVIGGDGRGAAYGLFSVAQQLELMPDNRWTMHCSNIEDAPEWRERFLCDYFAAGNRESFLFWAKHKVSGMAGLVDSNWRNPDYFKQNKHILDAMKELSQAGIMDFLVQLHIYATPNDVPKMNLADEKQIDQFISVCRLMAENGASTLMIAADDSTPRKQDGFSCVYPEEKAKFGNIGKAHGYLMKRIYEALHEDFPNLRLSMVPAPYAFTHGIGKPEIDQYVYDWAAEAPKEVWWVWTGHRVCSPYIAKADHDRMAGMLNGHKIYLFDNSNSFTAPVPLWNTDFYPEMKDDDEGIVFLLGLGHGSRPWETLYYIGANAYLWNRNSDMTAAYKRAVSELYSPESADIAINLRNAVVEAKACMGSNRREGYEAVHQRLQTALTEARKNNLPLAEIENVLWRSEDYFNFNPLTLTIPAGKDIELDGVIKADEWDDAEKVELALRSSNAQPTAPTIMYAKYGDGELRLAFDITTDLPLPETMKMPHDSSVYLNGECLEIFLQMCNEVEYRSDIEFYGSYAHLAVDSAGNTFDEDTSLGDWTYDGDWQSAVAATDHGWAMELRFKPSDLDESKAVAPAPGVVWRGNFHHVNNRKGIVESYSVSGYSFHTPNYFAIFNFK